jgi:hypothetical protein
VQVSSACWPAPFSGSGTDEDLGHAVAFLIVTARGRAGEPVGESFPAK